MIENRNIYFDNNATTKIDPLVLEAMMPFLTDEYANAASTHPFGIRSNDAVKVARSQVANLIGCETNEIIFTSGATEAINMAIKGVAESNKSKGKHIVTITTEHPAVLDTCRYLETLGYEITYLPVQKGGLLDLNTVKQTVRSDTILVSVMYVNNEIGVIQQIEQISQIAHSQKALFMTDGTQAVGKMPIEVDSLGIDLMSFSGHKIYGPKGVGVLFVRSRKPNKVKLLPLLHGGGHERGFRSGTLNVPGIVGLGKACELALQGMKTNQNFIKEIRNFLEDQLLKIDDTYLNGDRSNRMYNITNICFRNADSEAIIMGLGNIAVSNGSACSSTSIEPSHVLKELGLSDEDAFSSIRFSLGKFNTMNEVKIVLSEVNKVVKSLRSMIV